jgi:hypothetical protein
VHKRAPEQIESAKNGVNSAIPSAFRQAPLTLAAFNQRHKLEFFGYKDLQNRDLFGPAMAFRVTRTPGWLVPAITDGRPKYLPDQVLATLNRIRGGEKPDEFKQCLGRGKKPALKDKSPAQSRPVTKPAPPAKSNLQPFSMSLPTLTINKTRHRGQRYWRIIVPAEWAPVLKCKTGTRYLRKSKEEAQAIVDNAQARLEEFKKGNGAFTDAQFAAFRLALGMVGGDEQKVLAAVQQYVKREEDKPEVKPRLTKVVERHFLTLRKLNGDVRKKTLSTNRSELRMFVSKFGRLSIADISNNDLQVWIRNLKLTPKGKKNIKGTVKLVFDHAIDLKLRNDNPTARLKLPKVNKAAPRRFSAAECEHLLVTGVRIKSRFMPSLVVGLFSGSRPAEVTRTPCKEISMAEERINIPGIVGKTHEYRWVKIEPILAKWLKFLGIKPRGTLIPRHDTDTYERWRKQLAKAAGMAKDWPFDGIRHTNASFDYAICGNFTAVAKNLGNSVYVSRKNYIAPAPLTEAKQFLKLTPEYILNLVAQAQAGTVHGR